MASSTVQLPTALIFCPECEYNLTGLTECRCPECGQPYDPSELVQMAEAAPKPIAYFDAGVRLLVGPIASAGLTLLAGMTGSGELLGSVLFGFFVYAAFNSAALTTRILAARRVERGLSPYGRSSLRFLVGVGVLLFILHVAFFCVSIFLMMSLWRIILWFTARGG